MNGIVSAAAFSRVAGDGAARRGVEPGAADGLDPWLGPSPAPAATGAPGRGTGRVGGGCWPVRVGGGPVRADGWPCPALAGGVGATVRAENVSVASSLGSLSQSDSSLSWRRAVPAPLLSGARAVGGRLWLASAGGAAARGRLDAGGRPEEVVDSRGPVARRLLGAAAAARGSADASGPPGPTALRSGGRPALAEAPRADLLAAVVCRGGGVMLGGGAWWGTTGRGVSPGAGRRAPVSRRAVVARGLLTWLGRRRGADPGDPCPGDPGDRAPGFGAARASGRRGGGDRSDVSGAWGRRRTRVGLFEGAASRTPRHRLH